MLSSHRPSAAAAISAATAAVALFLPFQPESSFNPICRQSSSAALPTAIHAAVPRWTGEAVEAAAEDRGVAAVTPVTIEREKEEEQR